MDIFCIIPARGGSKGLPGKNITPFLGKPLLVHSIDYALKSDHDIKVFVSTDDNAIADAARGAGASIINRPVELSGDEASTESAIEHAVTVWEEDGLRPDIIILLQATSPLRPEGSLDQALDHFIRDGYDSMLSISPTHRFFWTIDDDRVVAEYDYMKRPRRQDMDPGSLRYVENGSVYIFTRELFLRLKNRLGGRIGCEIFPEEFSYEIDSEADLLFLEKIALKLKLTTADRSNGGQVGKV